MNQNATPRDEWFKSSLSMANGSCLEVRFLTGGGVQVRNSGDHSQGTLTYTDKEWRDFLGGARNGEFDDFGVTAPGPS